MRLVQKALTFDDVLLVPAYSEVLPRDTSLVTLLLDITKMIGFFAVMQLPFGLTAVAAILTIIGYSINDKVVVYDRMREINDENAKGITDAASGLAQSLADLKLRLRSEADRGKIEPIRTTVLPDFTAKVGELITMLNEANEVDRSVLIPNGAAIAEKVGQMRTNALAARATAESETAAK